MKWVDCFFVVTVMGAGWENKECTIDWFFTEREGESEDVCAGEVDGCRPGDPGPEECCEPKVFVFTGDKFAGVRVGVTFE